MQLEKLKSFSCRIIVMAGRKKAQTKAIVILIIVIVFIGLALIVFSNIMKKMTGP